MSNETKGRIHNELGKVASNLEKDKQMAVSRVSNAQADVRRWVSSAATAADLAASSALRTLAVDESRRR